MTHWTKDIYSWIVNRQLNMSIPFTWLLPKAQKIIDQMDFRYDSIMVGGPAVYLMPSYLTGCEIGHESNGILQRINPQATRTTTGCPGRCKFCGIGCGLIEPGGLVELDDWFDAPILCDNNLLAASIEHFDKVCDRLEKYQFCDFNQGLDIRYLNEHHAERLSKLNHPMIRLACDSKTDIPNWIKAFDYLRNAGISKKNIRSYALIAFDSGVEEAWERCNWIESKRIKVLPMWFHELDCLELNQLTSNQIDLGWDEPARKRIMGYYYRHRGVPLNIS